MIRKFITAIRSELSLFTIIIAVALLSSGCKKLLEVGSPDTNITGENVFTNDATAASVLTGVYTEMSGSYLISGEPISIGFLTGLSGDELTLQNNADAGLNTFYLNKLNARGQYSIWYSIYPKLFLVNSAIEKLPVSVTLTPGVRKQLLGEAKFMRAFFYFQLVNLYGTVPLAISTDYTVNSVLPRAPVEKVWAQIISDLKDAKDLLTPDYVNADLLTATEERVRPNKWAATALLARSYLYMQDWENAEIQSTEIIDHTSLYHLDSLDNVFLKNNPEAIWQWQPVNYGSNTEEAKVYIIDSMGFSAYSKPVSLSPQLMGSFENNDRRKKIWTDSIKLNGSVYHFPSKYKSNIMNSPVTEYTTILRLGEQYLIRAEARAEQNNIEGAMDDLNILRKRAWLEEDQSSTRESLLDAIYHERQVELFTEWGHRWFDLKRTKTVDSIMSIVTPLKGGIWNSDWQFYPILSSDILANPNLKQTNGY